MTNKQRGYINIDIPAIITVVLVIGAAIGAVFAYLVPWVWGYIKPLIHMLTA